MFTTPTTIIMSFGRPTELRTRMMRVEGGELDMGKLALVDALADDVATHRITPADGVIALDAIVAGTPQFGRVRVDAGRRRHRGRARGVLRRQSAGRRGRRRDRPHARLARAVRPPLDRSGARARARRRGVRRVRRRRSASSVWPRATPSLVTVAALIILLPGMSLTVAMTELATRNLIAGTARLMSAVIVLLELVVGVALGEQLARAFVHVAPMPPTALPEWTRWVALVAASLGVAVVVQARAQRSAGSSLACTIGYVGSRAGTAWLGSQMGVLVGAFALGVMSNAVRALARSPGAGRPGPGGASARARQPGLSRHVVAARQGHAVRRRDAVRDVRRRDRDRGRPVGLERGVPPRRSL